MQLSDPQEGGIYDPYKAVAPDLYINISLYFSRMKQQNHEYLHIP